MSKLDIQSTQLKRKYSKIRDMLPDIGHRNGVFVFPYELRSGYLNRTENGFVNWEDEKNIDSFSFFQKLITGKDSVNVVWEDSTKLFKPKGKNRYEYKFEVGKYYLGEIVGNEIFAETQFYDDDLNRKNIKVNNTVVLHFVYNEENNYEEDFPDLRPFIVEKEDMFKLYKIPQLFDEEWMYIASVRYETIPNDKETVGCFVTFVSLNEQLSKSGEMLEGFIHENSPCEPYAKPRIDVIENEVKGKMVPSVILDRSALDNEKKGVKYIQVEIFGVNALTAITVIGREIKEEGEGENKKKYFDTWKFLLPNDFSQPKVFNLEKTSSPSKNFYVFQKCSIEFTKSVNWIEQWKKATDVVATNNFSGIVHIGDPGNFSVSQPHYSNPISNDTHLNYYSNVWFPFNQKDIVLDNMIINSAVYSSNTLKYEKNDNFLTILIKNTFIYLTQLELPLDFSLTKPYKMSDIPIIGGIVSAFVGDRTLVSNLQRKITLPICLIMDCAIATLGTNILSSNAEVGLLGLNIPLSIFGSEDTPKYLGAETCCTALCLKLTKWLKDANQNLWDTKYLGQNTNEDGEYFYEDQQPFLYDATKTTADGGEVFAIDDVIIQGLIKGKIKLTFFGEDGSLGRPLWTTTVQSNAQFTNSIRNWTTTISTGCWNSKYIEFEDNDDEFTWPKNPLKKIDYGYISADSKQIIVNKQTEYKLSINRGSYINLFECGFEPGEYDISGSSFRKAERLIGTTEITVPLSSLPEDWGIVNLDDLKTKIKDIFINYTNYFSLIPKVDCNRQLIFSFYNNLPFSLKWSEEGADPSIQYFRRVLNYDAPNKNFDNYIKGYRFLNNSSPESLDIRKSIVNYGPFNQGWCLSCKCDKINEFSWYRKCWFYLDIGFRKNDIKVEEGNIKIPIYHHAGFVRLELEKNQEYQNKFSVTLFYMNQYSNQRGTSFGGDLVARTTIESITFLKKETN